MNGSKASRAVLVLISISMMIFFCPVSVINGEYPNEIDDPIPPKPAEFVVSNLTVVPEEVMEGEYVSVNVKIINIGDEVGNYTVEFIFDGVLLNYSRIPRYIENLPGGNNTSELEFIYRASEGAHKFEIDGLTASFVVLPRTPAEFIWGNFTYTQELLKDKFLKISIDVINVGGTNDSSLSVLYIDDVSVINIYTGVIDSGNTVRKSWVATELLEIGNHTIRLGEFTGNFTVVARRSRKPPEELSKIEVLYIMILLIAVVIGVVGLYIYSRGMGTPGWD